MLCFCCCITCRLTCHIFAVPEENLLTPDQPDMVSQSILKRRVKFRRCHLIGAFNDVQGRFGHPYISFLFYGMDSAGDFIPIKQLREKYNKPRHEVPFDRPNEEDGGKA